MTQQSVSMAQDPNYIQLQVISALKSKLKGGINWFYWIAGLSLLNSILYLLEADLSFIVGLGVTQLVDVIFDQAAIEAGADMSMIGFILSFGINCVIAGLFVLAGMLGRKRHAWAVIVGMVLYSLDGILLAAMHIWLDAGFHLLALYGLFRGLQAIYQLKKLDTPAPTSAVPVLP